MKFKQKGVTLVELSLGLVATAVIVGALFPQLALVFRHIESIHNDKFTSHIRQILVEFYRRNPEDFVSNGAPAATVVDVVDINEFATGALDDVSVDFNNETWHYVACSTSGQITVQPGGVLNFCDIIGYRNDAPLTLNLNNRNLNFWNGLVNDDTIERFEIISGRSIIQDQIDITRQRVERVRENLEQHADTLFRTAKQRAYRVNRYVDHSVEDTYKTNYDYDGRAIFDRSPAINHGERAALGFNTNDLITPLSTDLIQIDNTSANIRSNDHGHDPPYTAEVFVIINAGGLAIRVSSLAVTKN